MPSGAQSGLKIPLGGFLLQDGCEIDVLLDFDAEQSVHRTGKGDFQLKPVIHVKEIVTDCAPPPDPGSDAGGADAGAPDGGIVHLPPDPVLVAPPLSETGFPPFYDQISFLFDSADPIQTGVQPDALDADRVSVLHGAVFDRAGSPVAGVAISMHGAPELGRTFTRADGTFDFAFNGGGTATIAYGHSDYLTSHRQVTADWNGHVNVPDVVLVPRDPTVTVIDFTEPIEVARGSAVSDDDGTRRATLLFRQGTTATIVLGDGSTTPVPSISVRATEYTIGSNGPESMPAELPPLSGYTYAVELSIDEAEALSAEAVRFDKPVTFYLENFIGIPVGEIVPTGYYDRTLAQWIPATSGRVIEVLGIDAQGNASLDIDGDGGAAAATALADLGITADELSTLAATYSAGTTLWRVQLHRFSVWDMNWPVGCDPTVASCLPPEVPAIRQEEVVGDVCLETGSVLEIQTQVAGETVELVGVPFDLHYRSSRQLGYAHSRRVQIPILPDAGTPAGLLNATLQITNLGTQDAAIEFGASPPSTYELQWDGRDRYGRPLKGALNVETRLGYSYQATYQRGEFASVPNYQIPATVGRDGITFWQIRNFVLENVDDRARGLGGWSLGVHHRYNPNTGDLYLGTGETIAASVAPSIIESVIGGGERLFDRRPSSTWTPASDVWLWRPRDMAVGPDGALYVTDVAWRCVVEFRDGMVRSILGECGRTRHPFDPLLFGIPPEQFYLWDPTGVDVGPDGDIYVSDAIMKRVVKIEADTNLVEPVAGSGASTPLPLTEPTPADQADMIPSRVTVDANGTVYIANTYFDCVIALTPDGIVRPFLGNCRYISGWLFSPHDGKLASEIDYLGEPQDMVVDEDGSLLVALSSSSWSQVIRVWPDGRVQRVAGGNWVIDNGLDGVSALDVVIGAPQGLALDGRGGFFVTEAYQSRRIWHVDASGIATVVAGGTSFGFSGDGGSALEAELVWPLDVARGHDGSLYIADHENERVRRVSPNADKRLAPEERPDDGIKRPPTNPAAVSLAPQQES